MSESATSASVSPFEEAGAFRQAVDALLAFVDQATRCGAQDVDEALLEGYLDGMLYRQLRDAVPREILRETGVFFTNPDLADKLVTQLGPLDGTARILDPACGTGNLLLACASHLPIEGTLQETLTVWGEVLHGWDINSLFTKAARARLILLAVERGRFRADRLPGLDEVFPGVVEKNCLAEASLGRFSHVIANPPFHPVQAPDGCMWGQGKTNIAAVIVERLMRDAQNGARYALLLPDVLRSGTRYRAWRDIVAKRLTSTRVQALETFDQDTDVHVFTLAGTLRQGEGRKTVRWSSPPVRKETRLALEDLSELRVGPVVPYRDPNSGPEHAYLDAKGISNHRGTLVPRARRKAETAVVQPPFVAVLRTSRPEDQPRVRCVVVGGKDPVHVENHLIVVRPNNPTIASCRRLAEELRSEYVTKWLNSAIRCRHLTITALRKLPIKPLVQEAPARSP